MNLSAISDQGKPVDWWFMYKISGKATRASGGKALGTEYVYFDADAPSSAKLALSASRVDMKNAGALANTLNQIYSAKGAEAQHLGWFFYNDENPITGAVSSSRGHTKGVLAFDLGTNTAFWLVQSTPKFPPQGSYSFPNTGMPNAQTLLCITLADAGVSQSIAKQMFSAQQPLVYLASAVPAELAGQADDPRTNLLKNQVTADKSPLQAVVPFLSKGGVKFICMAKNPSADVDFYNDIVGPTLHDNLDVETWTHGPQPQPLDSDKIHTVVDMGGINLNPLGIDFAWPEADDHAKLAISARSESTHYVCIGDINFTISMKKRGGGTVAFLCEPLWSSISQILVDVKTHLKPGSRAEKLAAERKAKSGTHT
ncbi:MAG TPA: deoxyribonuclease II family protein [Candidatus Solibacter sp.]|nr:deoxyribonuclease II family protein [Candidatus Solibacter sp.]